MQPPLRSEIEAYYDAAVRRKLRDFVFGNRRVELAWATLIAHAGRPRRILEIGCGVGAVSMRLATHFPAASVVGVDISSESVALARCLFAQPNLVFELHDVHERVAFGQFDLVVLMDVYEHVPPDARPELHRSLLRSLTESGRVVLTWPTPRHLTLLKQTDASEIQPVDEEISVATIAAFARDLNRDVLLYREVGVWRDGDYGHGVIGRSDFPNPLPARPLPWVSRCQADLMARRRLAMLSRAGITLTERS